ncbi:Piezo-type mechanosensitive ion channel component 2, partial [Pseudolycoriella hygida]
GADFYLRPIYTIIRYWSYLIGYNIFVIGMKALLQIPACIFTSEMESICWLNQLFGISCIRKFNQIATDSTCKVPSEGIGLVWDGICFAFLLLQLRIFQSYYFCHIINESKASTILASRGAELIEGLRRKQVKLQIQREEEILLKIKQKMDRIKANQQKFQTSSAVDGHEMEAVAPLARTTSLSSCAGYHTPIEDEVAASELPSDFGRSVSVLNAQAPSPMSAVLTVSLEGYLDHQQISYGSPPSSDIAVRRGPSSEESYPVFSPLPT